MAHDLSQEFAENISKRLISIARSNRASYRIERDCVRVMIALLTRKVDSDDLTAAAFLDKCSAHRDDLIANSVTAVGAFG